MVGSGISGLAAAWLLRKHRSVTLFEAQPRLGGHTHTVSVEIDGIRGALDTGFLVFNDRTYPGLVALFEELGVESVPSDMSLSVRIESEGVEWAGSSLDAVFAQRRNLVRPRFAAMLADIVRFNAAAGGLARADQLPTCTLGQFAARGRYSEAFLNWYLLPMAAAIWSSPTAAILDFPAATLLRFFHNHGLLQLADRPIWRTVRAGARTYVDRIAAELPDVRLSSPVTALRRVDGGVLLRTSHGVTERFDDVVLACHSDQARALLDDASADERAALGAVRYQPNDVVLHLDRRFLPVSPRAWSSWNVVCGAGVPSERPVSVSYLVNRLQPLPWSRPVIVTLNPHRPPRDSLVLGRWRFDHPLFDAAAIAAQHRMPAFQGRGGVWFCGAWLGHGFHEDGLRSAHTVARAMGVATGWPAERTPA